MVFGEEGEDWTRDDLLKLGLELEKYAPFPDRVNVRLASVQGLGAIRIMIWERGSGECKGCRCPAIMSA